MPKNKPKRTSLINNFCYLDKVYLQGNVRHFNPKPNLSDELVFLITDIKVWDDNTTLYFDHLRIEDGVINKYMVGHEIILKGEVVHYQRSNDTYDYSILPIRLISDITVEEKRQCTSSPNKKIVQDAKDAKIQHDVKTKIIRKLKGKTRKPKVINNLSLADVLGE